MIVATAQLTGSVRQPNRLGALVGAMPGADWTLQGAVSTSMIASFAGATTATEIQVKIAGEWVPDEDLVGQVTIDRSIDTWRSTARFTLAGRRWQLQRTTASWTLTPAEVWRRQRGESGEIEEFIELRGFILPGTSQSDGAETTITVTIADDALYLDFRACTEVAPLSGLSRGGICRKVCSDIGLLATNIPDGSPFDKPLFTDGRPALEFLGDLGEPEGWSWRFVEDDADAHVLEAYVAEITAAPDPPTHVWRADDIDTVEVQGPAGAPTRLTVRGLGPVSIEEDGVRIETTGAEVKAPYAPVPAVARQNEDGTQTAVNFTSISTEQVVRRIEVEQRFRGDDLIEATTREFGFKNPRAPRLTARNDRLGPVDGYYFFGGSYIDAEGKFVLWPIERFVQVSERRLTNTYGESRDVIATATEEDRWHSLTSAVENTNGSLVAGAHIGDDDQSYDAPLERYGRAVRHETGFIYDAATGAATTEVQSTFGYYSPRAATDIGNHYLRFNGEARVDPVDVWMRTQSQQVAKVLTADKLEAGSVRVRTGFQVAVRLGGQHDYGGGIFSDQESEVFRQVEIENTQLNRRSDGTVEELTFSGDGPPKARIVEGGLPLPRFQSSPWTRITQEPIEILLDDDVLRSLFGDREVTLSSDFLTSALEAQRWANRSIRRLTSIKATVTRPLTVCRPGDTVLLVSRDDGLTHRALVVDCSSTDNLETGESTGQYRLEVPIL